MSARTEIKELLLDVARKWLIPDFSNKLTWLVAGVGTTILLTPDTATVIIANWLIDTLNINFISKFSLAELQESNSDKVYGILLIIAALTHNLIVSGMTKYLAHLDKTIEIEDRAKQREESLQQSEAQRSVDRELLKKFLNDLPSNGRSILFLRDHDLGGAFNESNTVEIEKFVFNWNCVERKFLGEELEAKRQALWNALNKFSSKLAMGAYDLHGGPMYSCIPDQFRGRDWPPHVEEKIEELNALGTHCFNLYSEFVLLARRSLQV
ncbi:hypothetical protein PS914_00716 [Pseudomonas fluorescens]|uniref:hypothetical protein n=1 Tax=Pseudomonas fluorescens TaxID=294 RepID=UPI0012425B66|nr:hypothetical protein [Pseudomonas fluorescens]VVP68497.1 hypothetical protein PS914_00716 [Pseudomonas fluorescens]